MVHAQLCLTLCSPLDCSPTVSSVHGIFLGKILKWVAISSSRRYLLNFNKKKKKKGDFVAAAAKSLQLCLTLCDPIDGSPPGSPVPGILQARTLEWVAVSFSSA